MQVEREGFYQPEELLVDVQGKFEKARRLGEAIDYLTFVPDGEPTLDVNLAREIDLLRPLGIKIAVITNATLIRHADVRENLSRADWVSLKLDSLREDVWRKISRPHGKLQLDLILDGMLEFSRGFEGEMVTETMLVRGVNTEDEHLTGIADFLSQLKPSKAYLSIPTRPPAEKWVRAPQEEDINRAYQILSQGVGHLEYLIGYEGSAFSLTGDVEEDLLSITSVHPMREDAVRDFLDKADADRSTIQRLIQKGQIIETDYEGKRFFMRRLR